MAKQINWVSLALKIIDKQNPKSGDGAKTIRYIRSYIDTLLDKGRLTEKQSQGLIRNIDIHLGITLPNQLVQIGRTTAWAWKKKGVATHAPQPIQSFTVEDHWQALIAHYGSAEAVAHAACDRIEGEVEQANAQTPPATEVVQKPLDRNQPVTVSIWDETGSGNLDYKDGSKEHIVFYDAAVVKKKLDDAGAPDGLWRSLEIAWDDLDNCDFQLGIIHGDKDPKGKKPPTNPDCIVVKATPHGDPSKRFVTFVQSTYPKTMLAGMDGWKKRKNSHPDIKGWIDGLAA
ncbi:hypothetical protein [Sphingobium baderi]|uniref:Uncharacterized protein n=1 Tax=Sphingobium baderi TaxID=1332080 RepID=A0A0S3F2L6_9SPHN|nr:hypothetical protein [Sphingobium baderi]ALR21891.1 hypothetical protein ATN00_17935 [Sphingobium baderi]